ncbi:MULTISPECIES: LPS translocon maturation chaperone LptM [Corallincola]|nr:MULTISPECIES: hypothetical protein [Corallincola]
MEKKIGLLLACALLLAAGCGNKGTLYLPEKAPDPEKTEQVAAPSAVDEVEAVPVD